MRNSTSGLVIAGMDIGYGNLKVVGGVSGASERIEVVLPAGAAPLTSMPRRSDSQADLKGGELVFVDGKEWAAGVEQLNIQNRARMTHDAYTTTPEYQALFLAGLARLGYRRIDVLVTGLPVSQSYSAASEDLKASLRSMMQGKKFINADISVDVGTVLVVPQPLGTFFGLASEPKYASLVQEDHLRTLVFDPGFFSVDWVMMSGKSVLDQFSGTSKLATSVILERAAALLTAKLRREITRDQLDAALRRGAKVLSTGFQTETDYHTALQEAAAMVTPSVIGDLRTSLRNTGPIDLIVLTGGGSWLYEDSLRAAFPESEVVSSSDHVLGNARGYHTIANLKVASESRKAAVEA